MSEVFRNTPAASPTTSESLARLGEWASGFRGEGLIIEWSEPDVEELAGIKVLIAPDGPYWAPSEQESLGFAGASSFGVDDVAAALEAGGYVFGGEELAELMFEQADYLQGLPCPVRR